MTAAIDLSSPVSVETPSIDPAPIDPRSISLRLQRRSFQRSRLSDDGFGDMVATIALNSEHEVSFEATRGLFRVQLSNCAISHLGLSVQQTWLQGAVNTVQGAMTPQGVRFFSRPLLVKLPGAPTALQLRAEGTGIAHWLAHPRTFAILHDHAMELLQASKVFFCVLDTETLIAVTFSTPAHAFKCQELIERHFRRRSILSARPLLWAQGFPLPIALT